MRGDEFNSIKVTNEQETFSSFEFGNAQRVEYSFYNDNKEDIKDEINENRADDHENSNPDKKRREREELEKLNQSSEGGSSSNASEESSASSGSSSSSSSSSSSGASSSASSSSASASGASASAGAAGAASSAAVTVAAVVIAVPTIIAAALITNVSNHVFTPSEHEISYVIDLEVDSEDSRIFGIFLDNPIMGYYEMQPIVEGTNEGLFYELDADTNYTITVLAYEKETDPEEVTPSEKKVSPKSRVETYILDELPLGDVLYSEVVKTLEPIIPEKVVDHIEITHPADKTTYIVYDIIDLTGLEISAIYDDPLYPPEVIDINVISFEYDFSSAGTRTVYFSWQGYQGSYDVEVLPEKLFDHIELTKDPKVEYYPYEEFDLESLEVTAYYTDSYYEPEVIDNSELNIIYNFSNVGDKIVQILYRSDYINIPVTVIPHITVEYDMKADFVTGESTVVISYVKEDENLHGFVVAVDTVEYELPIEVGEATFTLPTDDSFNYRSRHGFEFYYYYGDSEIQLMAANYSGYLEDSRSYTSEVYGFEVDPYIDYNFDNQGGYVGTMSFKTFINYVDDFNKIENFRISLATNGQTADTDFTYEYDLNPDPDTKVSLSQIFEEEKTESQITFDILQNETFTPALTYTYDGEQQCIVGDPFKFTITPITSGGVNVPRQVYYHEGGNYIYPLEVSYADFDEQGIKGIQLVLRESNGDGSPEARSEIYTDIISGSTVNFAVSDTVMSSAGVDPNELYLEVKVLYYNKEIVLLGSGFRYRNGQAVYEENTTLYNYSRFSEDNLVYLIMDYEDGGDNYEDFRLTLAWDETFETTTHYSYDFAVAKSITKQSVDISSPIGGGTFELRGTPYDYTISCYDKGSESRITIKTGTIIFDSFDISFGEAYSTINKEFEVTINHTTGNVMNNIMLELTNPTDEYTTYTWTLSDLLDAQQIDVSAAEEATYEEWDMSKQWNYRILVEQLKQPDGAEYETVEYLSGTCSFMATPGLEDVMFGSFYRVTNSSAANSDYYYLPISVDILDLNQDFNNVFICFDVDDLSYDTPVDPEKEYWGVYTEMVLTKKFDIFNGSNGYYNGWRQLDISSMMNTVISQNVLQEGENIKYTIYGSDGDSTLIPLKTDAIQYNLSEENEIYGLTATDALISGSGDFSITIAYSNNLLDDTTTIGGFDFLILDIVDEAYTYYLPISYDIMSPEASIAVSLAMAYIEDPAVEMQPEQIDQTDIDRIIAAITDSSDPKACSFDLYYHLAGSSDLIQLDIGGVTVYFTLNA